MSEKNENTFSSYLGFDFQQKLIWQLLVDSEFAEKTIDKISAEYFDDPSIRKLFFIISEFFKEYEKVPNIQNKTIEIAIKKHFSVRVDPIEEDVINEIIKKIILFNDAVYNKKVPNVSEIIQKETLTFVKQQEYRKFAELIISKLKSGDFRKKGVMNEIEEKLKNISSIGDDEDYGTEVGENIALTLSEEFREPIPTGIVVLDSVTGGGLGKGEMGIILTPSGVGKTTTLSKIANTSYELGKNVLQIIFEDTEEQIKRKHFTIWSGVKLSEIDRKRDYVEEKVVEKLKSLNEGRLVIKKFSQENTTMKDIRSWISRYEKKFGFKFDIIILDYLDCVEPEYRIVDKNDAELKVVKSFLALCDDLNIPGWTAIQSNRTGFNSEFLEVAHMGGSIKRYHKAHLFMSIAKTDEQRDTRLVNVKILKARFAKDGQSFKDSIVDNDTMDIILNDQNYNNKYSSMKEIGEDEINRLDEKIKNINKDSTKTTTIKSENDPNVEKNKLNDNSSDLDFGSLNDFINDINK